MGIQSKRRAIFIGATCAAGMFLAACASAPVQEMSDARQAIRAAQNAGAAQGAPSQLEQAQKLLMSAEKSLQKHMYRAAKRDAIAARHEAVEAMQAVGRTGDKTGAVETPHGSNERR
jgi:hypothetical protein